MTDLGGTRGAVAGRDPSRLQGGYREVVGGLRAGSSYWLRSYALLLRWELTGLRLMLPVVIAVQALSGVGVVFAIGIWFEDVPAVAALYACTGGAALALVIVSLVIGPQLVAQQKAELVYDFVWSLPAPRSAAVAAWFSLNLLIGVPAAAVTVLVGSAVHDFELALSPSILVAVVVTVYTATMVGYALAHALGSPVLVSLVTQLFIFVLFGFSPVLFPAANLPRWLISVNEWLPFQHMAAVVRGGLSAGLTDGVARSYAVLAGWAVLSTGVVAAVLGRRR